MLAVASCMQQRMGRGKEMFVRSMVNKRHVEKLTQWIGIRRKTPLQSRYACAGMMRCASQH